LKVLRQLDAFCLTDADGISRRNGRPSVHREESAVETKLLTQVTE